MRSLMSCQFIWSRKSPTAILPITSKRFLPCVSSEKKHFHKFHNNIGLFFTLGFFLQNICQNVCKIIQNDFKAKYAIFENSYETSAKSLLWSSEPFTQKESRRTQKVRPKKISLKLAHKIYLGTYTHMYRMQLMH